MIEAVVNSNTMSGIQMELGGSAWGALWTGPLHDYIRKHNTRSDQYATAVDKFTRSCAGYCVATYVLGVGDRHNGNIMMKQNGSLFHIDFGHFLGNFKSKFGMKRERTPFVFTQQMEHVILQGKTSKAEKKERLSYFEDLCVEAFNILRTSAGLLECMFTLMVSAGMPELLHANDVLYLREMLQLDLTPKEAGAYFKSLITRAVKDPMRVIDHTFHLAKHGG